MQGRKMERKSPNTIEEMIEERLLNATGGEGDWMLAVNVCIFRYQPTKPTLEEAVRFAETVNDELVNIKGIKYKSIVEVSSGNCKDNMPIFDEVILNTESCMDMFSPNGKEIH